MDAVFPPQARTIGRYALVRAIHRGKFSATYLALDPVMQREVILKAVYLSPPATLDSGDAQIAPLEAAFIRQAQAAGKLHHPHIVTVFDAGRVHSIGYLVIERVNGRPLAELLASGWRPQFVHCASILARVADAIEYAHTQGVAHGHLGPQHVLLQANGSPKIEGFGGWIDGGTGGEEALAHTEKLLPYFQNELTEQQRRRDIQALAALLYMMLTGKAPRVEGGASRSLLALRPDAPPAWARLVEEILAADHPATIHTAGDLRDVLTTYLWNTRKSGVAPATLGIPLAAPPQADKPPSSSGPIVTDSVTAPSRATAAAAAKPAAPATPLGAEQAAATDSAPATKTSLSAATSTLARLLWQHALQALRAHRGALAAVAALIGAGIMLGVLLAQLAGRAVPSASVAQVPVSPTGPAYGVLIFEVSPWGEVLVDNKPVGVAPPLSEVKLPIGRHTIEIRHGDRPTVAATVEVEAGKPLRIRHRFE
ncbi:MAG: protein kinase [Sutterellaceae bacterium]|nr:protein kinase [Burkholderiaceae bacterium]MDW8429631.1 protein kinase [Sutterellaceae bacterium]